VHVDVQLRQGASALHVMAAAHLVTDLPSTSSTTAQATAAALQAALLAVQQQLAAAGCTWLEACFVHLYLKDMAHFGVANAAYCKVLPAVGPPARACVQVGDGGLVGSRAEITEPGFMFLSLRADCSSSNQEQWLCLCLRIECCKRITHASRLHKSNACVALGVLFSHKGGPATRHPCAAGRACAPPASCSAGHSCSGSGSSGSTWGWVW
jgi:hypothetical protein